MEAQYYQKNTVSPQNALSMTSYPILPCKNSMEEEYDPSTSQKDFNVFINSSTMNFIPKKEWKNIVKRVEQLMELANNTINAELEVHIGRINYKSRNHKFQSGVSCHWFETQLKKMEGFSNWDEYSKEWEKMEELIFEKDIRLRRSPGIFILFIIKNNRWNRIFYEKGFCRWYRYSRRRRKI